MNNILAAALMTVLFLAQAAFCEEPAQQAAGKNVIKMGNQLVEIEEGKSYVSYGDSVMQVTEVEWDGKGPLKSGVVYCIKTEQLPLLREIDPQSAADLDEHLKLVAEKTALCKEALENIDVIMAGGPVVRLADGKSYVSLGDSLVEVTKKEWDGESPFEPGVAYRFNLKQLHLLGKIDPQVAAQVEDLMRETAEKAGKKDN